MIYLTTPISKKVLATGDVTDAQDEPEAPTMNDSAADEQKSVAEP